MVAGTLLLPVRLPLLALLGVAQVDSAALLRRARDAQADFEWDRRLRLPFTLGGSSGACDVRVGRFCYWHDPDARRPPPEASRIGEARARLIRVLDSVAMLLPADDWIAGQRVRYLVDAGRAEAALAAARGCRGTRWWCEALEGLARHVAGDFPGAERAFRAALDDMPAPERCRWTDLSVLLAGPAGRQYRRLECAARAELDARIWWLARPLFSSDGNDRRTEHFARLTMARAWGDAATPFGRLHGADVTELMVRYGWPVAWSQRSTPGPGAERVVVGSEREPSYHFLPESLAAPGTRARDDAPLARERYAPAYADTFAFFEPELSAFRHGDSTLVVAVYDLARDTLFRDAPREVALALARDQDTPPVVTRRTEAGVSGALLASAPWRARLASLEITAPRRRRAARGRAALPVLPAAGGRVAISDLLAFHPQDSLPPDLAAAFLHAGSLRALPRGARVGLYWEVYGLDPTGEPLAASVSVTPERVGWLRRAIGTLGLAGPPRRVRIDWSEMGVPDDGIAGRALVVDLSTLPPGRYRLEVRVQAAGADAAAATRPLRIVAP